MIQFVLAVAGYLLLVRAFFDRGVAPVGKRLQKNIIPLPKRFHRRNLFVCIDAVPDAGLRESPTVRLEPGRVQGCHGGSRGRLPGDDFERRRRLNSPETMLPCTGKINSDYVRFPAFFILHLEYTAN